MNIEDNIFKRMKLNKHKIKAYGFINSNNEYKYSKIIMNNLFKVEIIIDCNEKVYGHIYDLDLNEEYYNFRIINQTGKFVNEVINEYTKILNDIAINCFDKKTFITPQANRLCNLIKNELNDEPDFPWEKSPGFGVFRNKENKKWYALFMNIDRSKITNGKGEIEAVNIKVNDLIIPSLLKRKGYYEAYHMNKKYWLTIILDDTLNDKEIFNLIKESKEITK